MFTAGSIEIIFAGGIRISIVLAVLDTGDTGAIGRVNSALTSWGLMCLIIKLTGRTVPWMGMPMFQVQSAPLEESGPARADTESNEYRLYESEGTITHGCRDRS